MVIALHDRLSGHASRVRVLTRLRERDGVWWARKDQIAGQRIPRAGRSPGQLG